MPRYFQGKIQFKRLLTSIIHTSNCCTGSSFFGFALNQDTLLIFLGWIQFLPCYKSYIFSNKVYMNCFLCLCFLQHFNAQYYSCVSEKW